jgi:hypothetical protein
MSLLTELKIVAEIFYNYAASTALTAMQETHPKFTGSISTASVTSAGSASD